MHVQGELAKTAQAIGYLLSRIEGQGLHRFPGRYINVRAYQWVRIKAEA